MLSVQEGIRVENLHVHHPAIRATDWRSPLVRRLSGIDPYQDGEKMVSNSFRSHAMRNRQEEIALCWSGLKDDHKQCMNTYQAPTITEYAALGLACILLTHTAKLQITEVTRRGDRADYWIGDKDELIEISAQQTGELSALCDKKAAQLLDNPYGRGGYVCVAIFKDTATARLWYFANSE